MLFSFLQNLLFVQVSFDFEYGELPDLAEHGENL